MKQDETWREMLPVVDGRDRVVGQERRGVIHARGLSHRAVHVLVFDAGGRLYLQRRSAAKDTYPGCWTSSASGHVDLGETYDQAAARELKEELGLEPPLIFVGRLAAQPATDNEFTQVYAARTQEQPRPDPGEISEGRWFSWEEAWEMARRPGLATPSLAVVLGLAGGASGSADPGGRAGSTPASPRP